MQPVVAEDLPASRPTAAARLHPVDEGDQVVHPPGADEGLLGLEPGDPVADQPDGLLVDPVRHQRRHLPAARVARGDA